MVISCSSIRNRFPYDDYHFHHVSLHGSYFTVTVTANASVVRRWLNTALYWNPTHQLVVGMGVQWAPRGNRDPPADTMQLCIGSRCLIYQLFRAERVPTILRRFLQNPRCIFVGFRNSADWRTLMVSVHGLYMSHLPLDLRQLLIEDLADSTVERIAAVCLGYRGVRYRREVSMSNWRAANLRVDQVLQASLEVYCAFLIGSQVT